MKKRISSRGDITDQQKEPNDVYFAAKNLAHKNKMSFTKKNSTFQTSNFELPSSPRPQDFFELSEFKMHSDVRNNTITQTTDKNQVSWPRKRSPVRGTGPRNI
jgi:hypothetical protein